MADIKTRQVRKGSVKGIDRAANLRSHMKPTSIQTKEGVRTRSSENDDDEIRYANRKYLESAGSAVEAGRKTLVSGRKRMHSTAASRKEMIDIKTKKKMIKRINQSSKAEGVSYSKHQREKSAQADAFGHIKKGKDVGKADALKKAHQVKQMENARKTQLTMKKTAEKTAGEARKTVILAFKALRRTIQATKTLVMAIASGGWAAIIIILICVMFGAAFYFFGDESSSNYTPVSTEVEAYTPVIQKYANEYGVSEYVDLIKAVMMQESGGRGTDPMQCSESPYNKKYSKAPGSIKDPEYSIDCGVHYLADCLSSAKCKNPLDMEHIRLALQGYNFGAGYIPWAVKRDGGYTVENASAFSDEQAKKHGWKSYGDKQYVAHVLRYYPYGSYNIGVGNGVIVEVAAKQIGNRGGKKFWSWYGFTSRVEWCACYVSWCADQCGYLKSGNIPKFSLVDDGVNWFKGKNQWQKRSYKPAQGDIIFFDWGANGSCDHVGIVEKCDGKTVYTIEGNSGDACRRQSYSVGSTLIYGFGVPKY